MLREQSRLFREEVANLDFTTRNIVPNIDHAYYGVERPEGSELIPERSPRFFRTTSQGTVSSGGDTGKEVVLFLGGSTTECNEVDEQYRFPAVVARLLNDAGASVKTINGGVRGHTTQDSINALLNRPGFREADVIVLMENINDRMKLAWDGGYGAKVGTDAPTTGARVETTAKAFVGSLWDWLSYRSNALFLLRTRLGAMQPFTGNERVLPGKGDLINARDGQIEEHAAEFGRNLRIFVSLVKLLGKTPVLMTQALAVDSPEQARFNKTIREVAAAEEVRLIDLDAKLGPERKSAFLFDEIHLNNRGSARAAAVIANELSSLVGATQPIKE